MRAQQAWRLWDGLQVQIIAQAKEAAAVLRFVHFDAPNRKTGPRRRRDRVTRFQLLASKDLGKHHFDVNEGVQFVGRPGASGFDRNYFTALSYSRQLTPKWGYTAEIAGYSRTNAMTPANHDSSWRRDVQRFFPIGARRRAYYAVYGQLPSVTFVGGVPMLLPISRRGIPSVGLPDTS